MTKNSQTDLYAIGKDFHLMNYNSKNKGKVYTKPTLCYFHELFENKIRGGFYN